MRRVLLAAAVGTTLVMAAVADEDEVSTVDILAVLEEINEKLEREAPVSSRSAPDSGFGGGPFWPLRYLPGVADLNAYFEQLGSYEAMSEFFIPLKDGGGGTWRWSVDGSLQFGMEYAGFGQDVLGFARHAVDPLGPRDTVDEDGDGYDDYHSYAGYGQRYFAGIAQYKWALAPSLYLQTGIRAGLGFESLRYGMNRRQVLTDRLGITAGANSAADRGSLTHRPAGARPARGARAATHLQPPSHRVARLSGAHHPDGAGQHRPHSGAPVPQLADPDPSRSR